MVYSWVGDDDKTGLLERAGDVVGEGTRGETSSNSLSTSVGSEFQNGTVAIRTCRDNTDIMRVLNSGNNSSSKNELFPCLANVDDVDTCQNPRLR